jgi:Spy/CpxP family protein refolding chaperone
MKRAMFVRLLIAVALTAAPFTPLHAQRAGDSLLGRPGGPARQELERRFRERSAEIVRRQLQLNDNQMSRLQGVNRQFETQRVALFAEERRARQALRAELTSTNPNQQKVATLLDQLMGVSRRRFDIQASEQRELAKFLTPVQRAKYFGLQNQLRQRVEEVQKRGGQRGGRRLPPMRPPGGQRDFR